ncbi:hypothetical protein CP982_07875 [Streptomyces spectabilis]|uniref:Uncharacterized protein n=1 Tax=Streptomyces spectabilis TaxID=68270 RepID=A0A5P2X5V1_STRST|nr:hypothetical protein CP982_07875 [Streptomyces spectabilis]
MSRFPPQPQPPLQKKSRTNAVIIGSAAAVIAAVVATGVFIVNSRDDDKKAERTAKPRCSVWTTPSPTATRWRSACRNSRVAGRVRLLPRRTRRT